MAQKKINQILEYFLWIINPFMIILAVFFQQINPGLFFQWMGKFHPLLLHFPVVFGILIVVYFLFFQKQRFSVETEKLALLINAFLSSLTAILGLFLAMQNSYEGDLLSFHKWGGVAVALLSWLFIYAVNFRFIKILAVIFAFVLLGAAHKGAQLTHGINALDFPEKPSPETENLSLTDSTTTFYEFGIAPILEQKCVSCHGPEKTKGDLQLNSPENILKGGKNGNILNAEINKEAMLLTRIHLPLDDDDHMPPDGKIQLSSEEKRILQKWINAGAGFNTKVIEMANDDSLLILAGSLKKLPGERNSISTNLPDLAEFNSNYCSANYLYAGSDEAEVNFFQGSFYDRENLKNLAKIKANIVHLNLQGMPLGKEDLDIIVQFENLRKLNLNYTGLDIISLEALKQLPKLEALSICGVECNESSLDKFLEKSPFSSLKVWAENLNEKQLENLLKKYPETEITVGDNLENVKMKINDPVIEQDSSIIQNHLNVTLKHLLNGVTIRYSTNGDEPDSLNSKVYNKPIRLTENTVLKAKVFKEGWLSSNIVQRTFYKSEIHPDTIFLLTAPDKKYSANGAKTLVDFELGEENRTNGKWLGYRATNMEIVIGFDNAKQLKSVSFNALVDIGAYIFPVQKITVLGSNDGKTFEKIVEQLFPEATKTEPGGTNSFSCNFPESSAFNYYKFEVANLKKLPAWHPGKGEPAWIFVDELFLN